MRSFSQLLLVGLLLAWSQAVLADVIILSNHHRQPIEIYLPGQGENAEPVGYQLPAGRVVPLRSVGPMPFSYRSDVGTVRTTLLPNSVYNFHETSDSRLLLNHIDLAEDNQAALATGVANRKTLLQISDLPIKILVDDEEPATRESWEKRLRSRVAKASNVLEHYCLIRLKIVEVGTWKSDNRLQDFNDAFAEFQQVVDPAQARLAIGFTSQFSVPEKPGEVGRSSGLLKGHILLRESGSKATETELLEALLHELGHVLGAVDQKIGTSLMRPGLVDGQARRADFPLQYDPVNLLLMNLMGEEIRLREVQSLADLQPATRSRLRQIYTRLGLGPKSKPPEEEDETAVASASPEGKGPDDTLEKMKKDLKPEKKTAAKKRTTPHPDLKKFQGKWKVMSAHRRGRTVPEALRYIPTLSEDKLTLKAKDLGTFRFRMDIDPENKSGDLQASDPIPFDLVMRIQDKEYVSRGIYQYDGFELKVCCARPGKPRPENFKAPADVDQAVMVFRRAE